jgi:hypothetical protein
MTDFVPQLINETSRLAYTVIQLANVFCGFKHGVDLW